MWRGELLRDPCDLEALRAYLRLLMGAKLIEESKRYLERAIALAKQVVEQQQPTPTTASAEALEGLLSEWATFADMRGDFEEASRLAKWNIDINPDFTISLYGLVKQLAKLGRFPEAERSLARLKSSDPVWGHGSGILLLAIRAEGDGDRDIVYQEMAKPMTTNTSAGDACFILGDVESGLGIGAKWNPRSCH